MKCNYEARMKDLLYSMYVTVDIGGTKTIKHTAYAMESYMDFE